MSKLQATGVIKVHKARDVRPEEAASAEPARSRNRIGAASDQGVWSAALCLAFVSFLMPVWFLGVGAMFGASAHGGSGARIQFAQLAVVVLGAIMVWCGAGAAFLVSRAPRLAKGPHPSWLRWTSLAAAVASALFINCCVTNLGEIRSDLVAYAAAAMPAVLLAEVSFAMPVIAKNRHGVEVGWYGAWAWIAAAATTVAVGFAPETWWLPTVIATVGAYFTGMASVRVWQRYEGRIVGA